MPTIPITISEPGDLIDAATVNNDFTLFSVTTPDLDGDNTRTEWCSRAHITNPPADPVFNGNFNMIEDSDSTQLVNWNTFQQVNLAPAFRVTYGGLAVEPGQVLRAHLDINVLATGQLANLNGTINTEDDCYQFRFYFRDFNSGIVSPIGPTATYSVSNQWNIAFPAPGYLRTPTLRVGQRCNLSMTYVNTSGTNLVIDWIEARVRIVNLANVPSITIGQGDMTVMRGKY
jgi:hypothetical protein